MAGKNLLVNGKNSVTSRMLTDAQSRLANTTAATNVNNINTPNLPKTSTTSLNLQQAQQPVQTRLNNLNQATGIQSNNPAFNNGQLINQNNQPSRFIGFQNATMTSGNPGGKSFNKLFNGQYAYIPSQVSQAEMNNVKEEERYRTTSEALMDFQADVWKNQGKMTESQMRLLYPEFKNNINVLKELQTELRPIVQSGMGVDPEQLSEFYPELLQPKNVQDINELKKEVSEGNKNFKDLQKKVETALKGSAKGLSANGLRYLKDADTLIKAVNQYKANGVVGGATDKEILDYAIKQDPELQKIKEEMDSIDPKEFMSKNKSLYSRIVEWLGGEQEKLTQDDLQQMIEAKSDNTGGRQETINQAKTFVPTYIDTLKEYITRGVLDKGMPALKEYLEENTGVKIPDSVLSKGRDMIIREQIKEDEKALEERKAKNLNPAKQGYYENQSITDLLGNGDTSGAWYKMKESVAQNPGMIADMGIMFINPAVGLAVMGGDVYMQENQEAYKDLIELGATHEEAETGAMIVGGVNAAVEIFMERILGGAQRAGATAFRRIFLKNAEKELVKEMQSGALKDIVKGGLKEYLNGSTVEGLEEVVQTIVNNAAKQTYNENQDLFEGVGQAFEGGFYNPMNAIGGVTNTIGGISNSETIRENANQMAYNAGAGARELVDNTKNFFNQRKEGLANAKNKITTKKPKKEAKEETNGGWSNDKGVIGNVTEKITKGGTAVYDNYVEPFTDKIAEGITSTTDPQDKLFKALNPSLNVLSRKKGNYDTMRKDADRANELIVEYGYTPTNTAEYYKATQDTKRDLWNNGIQQGLDRFKYQTIDVKNLTNPVREELAGDMKDPLESLKGDVNLLDKELRALEERKIISLEEIERKLQQINAILERGLPPDASQIYEKGMRALARQLRVQEDEIISELPGEFRKFKKDYGTLLAIEEEAQKRMIQDMKKKLGGNLYQNWGRIEGLGKMIKKGSLLEGAAQFILGESLGKVKDTNFLIKSGFEALRKKYKGGKPEGVKIKKKPVTPALPDMRTEKQKYGISEVDNRTNKNKEEGYKAKNKVTGEKTAVTEKKEEKKSEPKAQEPKKQEPKKDDYVEEFKKKTDFYWKPIGGYNARKVEELLKEDIAGKLYDAGYDNGDFEIVDLAITGSRARNYAKDDSDLDIVVQFKGDDLNESELYNALNNEKIDFYGVEVDVNPILSDLGEHLKKQEEYMENAAEERDPNRFDSYETKKKLDSGESNIGEIMEQAKKVGEADKKAMAKEERKNNVTAQKTAVTDNQGIRTFEQDGKLASSDDLVEKLKSKKLGRFQKFEDGKAVLGLVNNFNESVISVADGDWQTAVQAYIMRDDKGEKVHFQLGKNTTKESERIFNKILQDLKIGYIVGHKDDGTPTVLYKKTGHTDDMKYGRSFNGVALSKDYRLGDTDFTIQRNAAEQEAYNKKVEENRAENQKWREEQEEKERIKREEVAKKEQELAEKRKGLQEFLDEQYENNLPKAKAKSELTKLNKDADRNSRIAYYEGFPEDYDNMEIWELLDILGNLDKGEIKEVREHGETYSYWFELNRRKDEKGYVRNDYQTHLNKYERDYLDFVMGKKRVAEDLAAEERDMQENPEDYNEELLESLFTPGGTKVKTEGEKEAERENKSGGNAFGLKEQKGSSRINNFTNVIKRIVDKYEGDIEDNSILIEKEPYLPLEITHNPEKNELVVRHINMGYDDPAMRFQILEDGKLHVTGVKLAFMEQYMGNYDWSRDINDKDELLHTLAVNLEDQFLGENTIDEDTGEMRQPKTTTEITGGKNAVTAKQVENNEPKNKITSEQPIDNAELESQITKAFDNGLVVTMAGGEEINGQIFDHIEINDSGNFSDEPGIEFYRTAKHGGGDEYSGIMSVKNFLDKYGKQVQDLQSVAKSENQNIIGKNNALTTNNPTNARNGENSNGSNKGQGESSNNEGVLGVNEGGRQSVSEESRTSGGEKTLMSSSDNNSQRGTGLKDGASPAAIWTKGNDVITTKTVTQARDTNRDCVNILEKHNYSTNPADYTEEEINTLRQYEGRGGVNDRSDLETQGALNQYYTKDNIIKAMWRLLDGYNNQDILEPSMGVGRFFMYAPEGSNLAGFEYDKIPGTIAKILYPNADIQIGDFQDNFMVGKRSVGEYYNGKKYDIVIGNPPYEERQGKQMGLGEEPKINRFDDYFIKRGIDMLKPGGHLAFVTSSQFLRGADNYAKQKISEKAELIDAYRIPIGAFDRTGVETDIVVFEKKEGGGDNSLLSASKWFDKHPDKVLGEERNDIQGRFGPKTAVVGDIAAIDDIGQAHVGADGLPATLEAKFTPKEVETEKPKNVLTSKKTAATQDKKPKIKSARKEITPQDWTDWTETKVDKNGNETKVVWGKSYKGVLYRGKEGQKTGRLVVGKGGIGKYQNLLNPNGKIGDPSITLDSDREGLNYINGELEPNILYAAGYLPDKLEQLEKDFAANKIDEKQYNKQKDLLEQAMPEPIVFQDIDWSPYQAWILNTPTETMRSQWKSGEGYVDTPQTIKQLFKSRIGDRKDQLGTVTVTKITKDGVEKTDVQSIGTRMINALDGVGGIAPEMKDALTVKMPENFSKFMKSQGEVDENTKQKLQDEYNKRYNSYANFDYADLGYTIDDISETFMGQKFRPSDVQARGIARILTTESMLIAHGVGQGKTLEGIDGAIASMQQGKATKCLIIVPGGTKASRMQTIANHAPNQEVVDLGTLAAGSGIRDRLSDAFGHDPRNWIKPGQIAILEHSAIGKQISFKPDTLAMLQEKLTDTTNTPFSRETEIRKKEREMEELEAENNDYWISNSQLEKNKKRIEKISGELEKMQGSTDFGAIIKRYTGKGLPDEGIMEALKHVEEDYDTYLDNMNKYIEADENIEKEKAIKIANKIYDNERPIYLEELGIDHVTVDEAHNFRNLFNKAIDTDENGEGGNWRASVDVNQGSAAAMNLYGITQYIQSQNYGGNVVLLTATPFINEPSEVYNMLSYVGKNGMEQMGVETMDDFFDTYVGLTNKQVITPSGTDVKNKNVMVQFNNTKALIRGLLDRYIDYEGESESIVKPRQKTYVIRLKMSGDQDIAQKKLEVQIDENKFDDDWNGQPVLVEKNGETVTLNSTRKMDDKGRVKGAVIEGMGQANNDLISPYLTKYMKDKIPDLTPKELIDTSPKLNMVVQVIKTLREYGIKRGVFVYMPVGTQLHELLQKAIELENQGIKVGIINGESRYKDMTDTQAKKLGLGDGKGARARETAKRFSDGELDVLIGGENTKEGLNLQGNGYITIEVSQPRNLNDLTQLHGRVDRQGNLSNEVLVITLLMENSSDIYRYQRMEHKNSRRMLLEMLSAYKRGEEIENVVPQGDLDLEEQKLALFTDPERKAKISIVMDKADLVNKKQTLSGTIKGLENILQLIEGWGNGRGNYRDIANDNPTMDLKDNNGKVRTTNILDDDALEPLEQLQEYYYNKATKAIKDMRPEWNKAEIDKAIRKEDPYSSYSWKYNDTRRLLSQARGDRNAVIRQMNALGIKTKEELESYLSKLHEEEKVLQDKIDNIENTKAERAAEYKRIMEENAANALDVKDILEDLKEEFRHQITLGSKEELRNWLKVTEKLPQRKQATSKSDIAKGLNKYEWESKDYVGIEPKEGQVIRNKVTSNFGEYGEGNPRPNFEFKSFVPQVTITKEDGRPLTKIGYQDKLHQGIKEIEKEEKIADEENKSLENNTYYNTLVSRAKNNVLKLAKRYTTEIIEAYERENPELVGDTNPENFKNYINDYKIVDGKVNTIRDDLVQPGAEYLSEAYQTYLDNGEIEEQPNNVIATDKNRVTSGKTMAARVSRPSIRMNVDKYINQNKNIVVNPDGKQAPVNNETKNGKKVVVDSKGKAYSFFHGTPNGGFNEFDMNSRGSANDLSSFGDFGKGFYFTTDKQEAINYATLNDKVEGKNPEVYEVKLYMNNPLDFRKYHNGRKEIDAVYRKSINRNGNYLGNLNEEEQAELDKVLNKYGFNSEEERNDFVDLIDSLGDNRGDWDMAAHGYDGVIGMNGHGEERVVFDKNQIEIIKHEKQQKNGATSNDKNRVTNNAARINRPSITIRLDNNGNPVKKNKVTNQKPKQNAPVQFSPELVSSIDELAEERGIQGNTIKKIKLLNKAVDKGKGYHTEIENEIYELKKQVIIQYVRQKGITIEDKGQKKTTIELRQGRTKAHPHIVGKLYRDLKREGIIR